MPTLDSITKRCISCKTEYPATPQYFRRNRNNPDGLYDRCKVCIKAWELQSRRAKGIQPKNKVENGFKGCPSCNRVLPVSEFYTDKHTKTGIRPICMDCGKQRTRDYVANNRDQVNRNKQEWYYATIEERRAASRKFHQERPEVMIAWREANKTRTDQQRIEWRQKNPQKVLLSNQKRRAKVRSLPYDFTESDWKFALAYFQNHCACCGIEHSVTLDHWIPVSHTDCPGTVPTNVVPLCEHCNYSKHNIEAIEWVNKKFGVDTGMVIIQRIETYFKAVRLGGS